MQSPRDNTSSISDSGSLNNALLNATPSPRGSHGRSRTPSFEGPRLSFSHLSRGELPRVVIPEGGDRRRILLGTYAVLFTRYNIATFLSAFFGGDATAWGMSGTWQGLIFAAYPLGMALTSLFAPQVVSRIGTRRAVIFGLLCTSLLTLVFGLAPDFCPAASSLLGLEFLFFALYFLNGLTGALAETACIMLVSCRFQDKLGTVMASIGTVSGLGCMVGPVIGGVLHDAVSSRAWAFRLPFLVCSAAPVLLLLPIALAVPQSYISDPSPSAEAEGAAATGAIASAAVPPSKKGLFSLSFGLGLSAVALSGTLVATLDPTLILRLEAPPFAFSDAWVSYMFMFSSVVYVAVSVPIGRFVDGAAAKPRSLKLVTAAGFVVLALTFALLAPLGLPAWGFVASDALQPALNNVPAVVAAMLLKGVGSALSNNAVYPDLVYNHDPEDQMLQATISGLWNAAYAVGWAAGPFLGGVLYDVFGKNTLCVGSEQLRSCSEGNHTLSCSCSWLPENGFDGFSSATALVSLLFAAILSAAAVCNVRNTSRHVHLASIAAPALDPLIASLADRAPPEEELDKPRS